MASQIVLSKTEGFADQPLGAPAMHGVADPRADGETEPVVRLGVGSGKDHDPRARLAHSRVVDRGKLERVRQSMPRAEGERGGLGDGGGG